jgi:hypothetical protein
MKEFFKNMDSTTKYLVVAVTLLILLGIVEEVCKTYRETHTPVVIEQKK